MTLFKKIRGGSLKNILHKKMGQNSKYQNGVLKNLKKNFHLIPNKICF